MANFLGQLFGTKADRDMKELRPILQNVIHAYEPIKELTNDELRHKNH
jgi:preprotein translocase subunit SecA